MTEKRLVILMAAFTAFAFIIELNMVYINVSGRYCDKAQIQQTRQYVIDDDRGVITDCNFNNITNMTTQYKTLVTAYDKDLQQVFNVLDENEKSDFEDNIKYRKNFIATITKPVADRKIYTVTQRYSNFNIAQHLVGYTDKEGNGISGLERVFDEKLKGAASVRYLDAEINGYGEITSYTENEKAENQYNTSVVLALTVDNTIQRLCEGIAKEYIPNGSIVVMESKTGKIKAMVSTPFYSANNIAEALNMENSPLVNKALQAYEPGSVIKPLWAAVLLENGYSKDKIYNCTGTVEINGHEYHCNNSKAHGPVDMEQALVVSCNCYFINAYIKNKAFSYNQMGKALDFGDNIYLAQNYSTVSGYFPKLEELENLGQLASVSFGQGKLLLTPVHITAYMNIFANGGKYVNPQIALGFYDADSHESLENLYQFSQKQVISANAAQNVKSMLQKVVEDGAMGRAAPQYFSAGGKTGTAQTGKYTQNGNEILTAWFCGFYPYDNPEYTICITMYNGGESTYTAAPVFKKICDSLYYLL